MAQELIGLLFEGVGALLVVILVIMRVRVIIRMRRNRIH